MKLVNVFIIFFLLQTKIQVNGQESFESPQDPYMVTSSIPTKTIETVECIEIIRNMSESKNHSEEVGLLISDLQENMSVTKANYDKINQEIFELESGETDSLAQKNYLLEETYAQLYQEYYDNDEEFAYLSEDQQILRLDADSRIVSLKEEILLIEDSINQLVLERGNYESYYQQLSYDLENLSNQNNIIQEDQQNYNQCLLYAYAAPFMEVDNILLNPDNQNFSEFLLSVDQLLQKIIPKAYQEVSYEEIYLMFKDILYGDGNLQIEASKLPVLFDESNAYLYEFQKELNLNDIGTLAKLARKNYDQKANIHEYIEAYQTILSIKNQQFLNFYAINKESLDQIKNTLVEYLNRYGLKDQETIYKIRNLNLRYQVKLALYDDIQAEWIPGKEGLSGYLQEYLDKEFLLEEMSANDDRMDSQSEPSLQTQLISDINHQDGRLSSKPENKFSKIKDSLAKNEGKTKTKELSSKESKDKPKKDKEINNQSQLKLPSTGELSSLTEIIIGVLALVLGLFLLNLKIKAKHQKTRKDIHLD